MAKWEYRIYAKLPDGKTHCLGISQVLNETKKMAETNARINLKRWKEAIPKAKNWKVKYIKHNKI